MIYYHEAFIFYFYQESKVVGNTKVDLRANKLEAILFWHLKIETFSFGVLQGIETLIIDFNFTSLQLIIGKSEIHQVASIFNSISHSIIGIGNKLKSMPVKKCGKFKLREKQGPYYIIFENVCSDIMLDLRMLIIVFMLYDHLILNAYCYIVLHLYSYASAIMQKIKLVWCIIEKKNFLKMHIHICTNFTYDGVGLFYIKEYLCSSCAEKETSKAQYEKIQTF